MITKNHLFSALPGNYRYGYKGFDEVGFGRWWSSSESSTDDAYRRNNYYNGQNVGRSDDGKEMGFSVRCVRD